MVLSRSEAEAHPLRQPAAPTASASGRQPEPLREGCLRRTERVYLRRVRGSDRSSLIEIARRGQPFHHPWIRPPMSRRSFKQYLCRTSKPDAEGLVCCLCKTGEIAGVFNLNNIVRGSLLTAFVAYYANPSLLGKGYMTEGLKLSVEHAFLCLGLHRLEAMVQPDNTRSRALVERCGFRHEGVAKDYQYIEGSWRDHERWAIVAKKSDKEGFKAISWSER